MNFDQAHRAIKKGDMVAIRQAIRDGLSPNLSNRYRWTLLMIAALEGNTAISELLVTHGADIHALNHFGETALSLAAHKGHAPLTEWLLGLGASAECRPHGWQLSDWIRETSGLPPEKISRMLTLLGDRSHLHQWRGHGVVDSPMLLMITLVPAKLAVISSVPPSASM